MSRVVIVAYKPKQGKEDELEKLMETHLPLLRSQDLVTARESIIVKSEDGTIIEVFEWKSKESMEQAHTNKVVQEMWQAYASVCDYIPVSEVKEAQSIFSEFSPIN